MLVFLSTACLRFMSNIIEGDGFNVNIIKSARRKTMALKVNHRGVSIHIPSNLSLTTAKKFIVQKTAWIKHKLEQQTVHLSIEKQYIDGEIFSLLGEPYTLRLHSQETSLSVNKIENYLDVKGRLNRASKTSIQKALINWYKQQAEQYLNTQTQFWTEETGLQPRSITVKTYKARWGSCKINGDIQFNWKLILAPVDVIDYVIVHELCHLEHHNHSALFWQLVEKQYPNFKQARQWLKNHGSRLEI
jgi:predicted metal-dependent hydrolase